MLTTITAQNRNTNTLDIGRLTFAHDISVYCSKTVHILPLAKITQQLLLTNNVNVYIYIYTFLLFVVIYALHQVVNSYSLLVWEMKMMWIVDKWLSQFSELYKLLMVDISVFDA